jgi:hypothetical protein
LARKNVTRLDGPLRPPPPPHVWPLYFPRSNRVLRLKGRKRYSWLANLLIWRLAHCTQRQRIDPQVIEIQEKKLITIIKKY